MSERTTKVMAGIGGGVAVASAVSPKAFLRIFGIGAEEVSGAAAFGWRLFAVRTALISGLAYKGDETARRLFLPVQLADQVVFWHAYKTRSVPPRAAFLAAGTSALIVLLDLLGRRASDAAAAPPPLVRPSAGGWPPSPGGRAG